MSEEVRSPQPNSDQFDALIELLATDDAGDDSNFHILPDGTASEGLRDAEGKLDYAKIRSLFLQRRAIDNGDHVSTSDQPQGEPNSGIKLPQIVVEEPTALVETFLTEPLLRKRDDEPSRTELAPKDGDIHYSQSVLPPEASGDSLVHHLQDALSKAREDVARLRDQVLQLQTQATKLFESDPSQDVCDTRGYPANSTKPPASTLPESYVQDAFGTGTRELTTPANLDRPGVEHAMQFLIRADELVWRRSRYPNSPTAPVFSRSNVDALMERLTLWENIVRAPVA